MYYGSCATWLLFIELLVFITNGIFIISTMFISFSSYIILLLFGLGFFNMVFKLFNWSLYAWIYSSLIDCF